MSERSRVSDGYAWRGGRVVRMCGRCSARAWGGAGACGTDARYAEGARAMHVRRMPRRGSAGGCGAVLSAPNKKQGCRRQPCSLSMLDSLKPMQFGFFGSRGLLGRKVLEWGLGRSPIYNGSEAEPSIYSFSHGRGVGQRPTYLSPSYRGAGRPAPPIPFSAGREAP